MDFDTRATLAHIVVTDVQLRTGTTLEITEARLQFGMNCNTQPTQIRLWTHTDTVLANDLAGMGMAALAEECRDRSTRNIVTDSIPLDDFIRHEMSPSARLLHLRHKNLPEMWTDMLSHLDDPLGVSTAGHAYVHRTDIVVVHQTAAHFVDGAALDALPLGVVLLFTVADVKAGGLGFDTLEMVQTQRARGRAGWVEVLHHHTNRASLTSTFRRLLRYLPEEFQSCAAPQENLLLHVTAEPGTACFLVDDKATAFLGFADALRPVAPCTSLFTPYAMYAMGSASMHYSLTRGLLPVCGEFMDNGETEVTTLAHLLATRPSLQTCIAKLLLYEVACLQPAGSVAQVLAPYDALRKQAAALRGDGPLVLTAAATALMGDATAAAHRSPEAAAAIKGFHTSLKTAQKAVTDPAAVSLVQQACLLLERVGDWCLSSRAAPAVSILQTLYAYSAGGGAALPAHTYLESGGGGIYAFPSLLPGPPGGRHVSQSASYTGGV